ncbi:hypothetical protein Q5752_004541 [Cryptotrichosporon argae]
MASQTKEQQTTAVVYKPNEHADEYLVFVDDENEYKLWKEQPEGGKDIALARFVGNFDIYKSGTGHTGHMGIVSKQEIESAFFDDSKNIKDKSVDAAIVIILQHGQTLKKDRFDSMRIHKNPARGTGDTRGTGAERGQFR